MSLLQEGELEQAVPLLDFFLKANPDDTDVLYNLGMALSDLGRLDEAKKHLQHLLELQPEHGGGLVALGVAHQRSKETQQAAVVLERAVRLDRTNGYAHRNLGSVLRSLGKHGEAEKHFRAAYELMPNDQRSVFGLAQALEQSGDPLSEADQLYLKAIKLDSDSQIGVLAREARSKMAEESFRKSAPGGIRMDAVMYLLGALEKFSRMTKEQIQTIAFEVAMLGMNGLDTNDSAQKYTIRSLPGNYSGLHLVCLEYAGFKEIEPGVDIGFDLSKEYEQAQLLFGREGK
jgi:tetratricopeptide (TPR) repeat protein